MAGNRHESTLKGGAQRGPSGSWRQWPLRKPEYMQDRSSSYVAVGGEPDVTVVTSDTHRHGVTEYVLRKRYGVQRSNAWRISAKIYSLFTIPEKSGPDRCDRFRILGPLNLRGQNSHRSNCLMSKRP